MGVVVNRSSLGFPLSCDLQDELTRRPLHGAQVHLAVSRQEFYKQNRETDEEIPLHLAMLLGEEVGP